MLAAGVIQADNLLLAGAASRPEPAASQDLPVAHQLPAHPMTARRG
jgi:hypothetical protein